MNNITRLLGTLTITLLVACGQSQLPTTADQFGFSPPSAHTIASNQRAGSALPPDHADEAVDARRGLLATPPPEQVHAADGRVIWDISAYDFIDGEAPASVNPSLWRQEKLNNIHGLFKVTDRVYQLRGFDLANMTIIEGDSGWIIVDTLTSAETAAAALAFARQQLGEQPIRAIIFTHSHMDHFGGALGITDAAQVAAEGIEVVAPAGFMAEATRENVMAGIAMARRSALMYGLNLPRSAQAQVGSGLGKTPALGSLGILAPTQTVDSSGTRLTIDGVEFVFQMVSGSEAPAEFIFYLPQLKVAMGAELVSQNMHNLYSLRGASIRDAVKWSQCIDSAINLFASAEVLVNGHHWPVWGRAEIREFLELQRDLYRYIHDQSVRLLNQGLTGAEIAEQLQLPKTLASSWANRGYYGSLSHNAKAVYQQYMGWFDANPAHLNPLPPVSAARKYVQLAGGEAALLATGQEAYRDGEYRWAAELLNHLVFANPEHSAAREWLARSYDQLGYQAESGPWRNFYLSAAAELRFGPPRQGVDSAALQKIMANTELEDIFAALAVRLNGPAAEDKKLSLLLDFSDSKQRFALQVSNSVLHYRQLDPAPAPPPESDVSLRLTRPLFNRMITGSAGIRELLLSDELQVDGNPLVLVTFFGLLDRPDGRFNLVTP
ncbi:MAG: MBL fold metallo-hydrolase [Gammaproteobacteria bacterium]|uniref:alkyl/aryl-sulfatase n=1 Tax=Pseudomaricurvus alcaniphilus TaxID=1166482 RepID=UPI001407F8F1|nr:alkyl sulfatase dimerization domain-containing protein [Pseudomaricurvus alcaniphilus]MBR9909461.1 MBL fold metallo-hydrolase [Gammaproteobacteria bacterium]NHN37134.1 MBL fold metallo-hydrolase [Pseudomaricurvus alcaniphilus]